VSSELSMICHFKTHVIIAISSALYINFSFNLISSVFRKIVKRKIGGGTIGPESGTRNKNVKPGTIPRNTERLANMCYCQNHHEFQMLHKYNNEIKEMHRTGKRNNMD